MVKQHIAREGWPEEAITIGPGSCQSKCRKHHAYAYCVGQTTLWGDMVWHFVYDRPCNPHESAWDIATRRREGLPDA